MIEEEAGRKLARLSLLPLLLLVIVMDFRRRLSTLSLLASQPATELFGM